MTEVNKKEIRTLTFHHALNYGAVLQAYALCRCLKDMGFNAKVLDYLPWYFALQTYRPAKGIKKTIDKFKKIIGFYRFRKKYLPVSKKTYFKASNIKNNEGVFAYVCGSDQIWNKNLTSGHVDDGYILNFNSGAARKIAYAASSGGQCIASEVGVLDKLREFDGVGVRESGLMENISRNSDITAHVVLDPSLLIRDYSEVARYHRVPKNDFILTYVVGSGEMLSSFERHVEELKKVTDLPVVHIGSKGISNADYSILDIAPQDWVAFFERAKYVVTNSFHGVAFSVNFEKQFLFVPHSISALNQRQVTFLNNVGLMERYIKAPEDMGPMFMSEEIDYSEVTPILDALVDESKSFLRSKLSP